uniref:RGS domain-containing protein n=1 Tax=Meloidogyne hapla TaxID=6305 RepID=A0A1I8BSW3_MELHA
MEKSFVVMSMSNLLTFPVMNSLNHVENELSSRVNIVHNLIYENQHQNENYVPIIFTFKRIKRKIDNKRPFSMWINEMDIDATLTKKEIEELASFLENAPNNLYEFFYSEYLANNNKIRNLLQEYYINKQLIDQTLGNEYNPELCEMIEYRGVKIPPQDRKIILPSDGDEHNSSNLQGGQSGRGGSHVPGGH